MTCHELRHAIANTELNPRNPKTKAPTQSPYLVEDILHLTLADATRQVATIDGA